MIRDELERLSKEELIELVLRLQRPDKTSRTSSKPPSTDRKERRENAKPGGAKPGHEGHKRELCADPDEIRDHVPTHCEHCGCAFEDGAPAELIGEFDEIEIPPVRPLVRRHRRFAIRCACCGGATKAAAPPVAQETPFGPRIHALAIYLKSLQALSYERLQRLFDDLFGLTVSQGALMNMFARTAPAFEEKRGQALAVLRQANCVASDETGVRIEGVNAYHWVFRCKAAVVHKAAFTRSAELVRETMDGASPKVWTSDRYSAQQNHAEAQQTCLAHETNAATGSEGTPYRAPGEARAAREAERAVDNTPAREIPPDPAQSEAVQALRFEQRRVLDQASRDEQQRIDRENAERFR